MISRPSSWPSRRIALASQEDKTRREIIQRLVEKGAQTGILESYLNDDLRPARDRAIVEAWEIGLPVRAIADAARVSAARVQQIVDGHADKRGRKQNRSLSRLLAEARTEAPEPSPATVRKALGGLR